MTRARFPFSFFISRKHNSLAYKILKLIITLSLHSHFSFLFSLSISHVFYLSILLVYFLTPLFFFHFLTSFLCLRSSCFPLYSRLTSLFCFLQFIFSLHSHFLSGFLLLVFHSTSLFTFLFYYPTTSLS